MTRSSESTAQVREHFRRKAFSFDHLYDEEHALQRLLRPGLFNRRELAVSIAGPRRALRVGRRRGLGRVGEFALDAGASRYVDIDLSDTMLEPREGAARALRGQGRARPGRLSDRPARGAVRHRPRPRLLRLHRGRSGAHPADVRAMRGDGRRQLPTVDVDERPDPQVRYEIKNKVRIFDYTEAQLRGLFSGLRQDRDPVGPKRFPVPSRPRTFVSGSLSAACAAGLHREERQIRGEVDCTRRRERVAAADSLLQRRPLPGRRPGLVGVRPRALT